MFQDGILAYHFRIGLLSLRRHKFLTMLMVLAIGMGIGAAMTTLTVFFVVSGDPIPEKSARVFHPRLDASSMSGYVAGSEPPDLMTRLDAENLLRDKRGKHQAAMYAGSTIINPGRGERIPFKQVTRYTTVDFFVMFQVPFTHGGAWSAADEETRARVVVLGEDLNRRLFGGVDSVGRTVQINDNDFRVIGVVGRWHPQPNFYDVNNASGFGESEQLFLPFSTSRELRMGLTGAIDCWGEADKSEGRLGLSAPCAWVQYWVELDSPADAAAYHQYLADYSAQQRQAGRYERPVNVRLDDVRQWLDYKRVLPGDVRLQAWLAFGFLLVCLLNTMGLLLAKFLRRSAEIGVRRALGAARSTIFAQCLVEAGVIGLAGSALGLLLAYGGLWLVRQQPVGYASLAQLDPQMLFGTVVLAIVASLVAGVFPAWRACLIAPAIQLKSQ